MILFNNLDRERNGCFHSSSRDSSLVAISFYFFLHVTHVARKGKQVVIIYCTLAVHARTLVNN